MKHLNFLTPVVYHNHAQSTETSLLMKVDNYFYMGGRKAQVIQGRTKSGQERVIFYESEVSLLERIAKIFSYLTLIIPLIMLILKAVLRSLHSFKIITDLNPRKKLENAISVSEDNIASIQRLMSTILKCQKHKEIQWLEKNHNLIFKLMCTPGIVYTMANPDYIENQINHKKRIDKRFKNMIKAKQVCIIEDLDLLEIPAAKKIKVKVEGKVHKIIAAKHLDFNSNESANEDLYYKYSHKLNKTMHQLAIFVAKTGFNVSRRKIPLLNEASEYQGSKRVALFNVENMTNSVTGFLGDSDSSGLIGCLPTEKQIQMVIDVARQEKIAFKNEEVNKAKCTRLQEIADNNALCSFYANRSIITGKELIVADLDSLDMNFDQETRIWVSKIINTGMIDEDELLTKETITLRQATEDVILEINRLIQFAPSQSSIKSQRYIILNHNEGNLSSYAKSHIKTSSLKSPTEKQSWLDCIIQALVSKGHLFKLYKVNGHGYFVQA